MSKGNSVPIRALKTVLLILVLALPLATPLSVWAGSHSSILIVSGWKEILLLTTLPLMAYVLAADPKARNYLFHDRSIQLSVALILLYGTVAILRWGGLETLAGLAIGTRFLYVYIVARLVGYFDRGFWRRAARYLIIAAATVSLLAVMQVSVLPRSFLTHVGYDTPGQDTAGIPPAYHLISGSNLERAQSTLRGPNVLGAFLILPIILVALWSQTKRAKQYKQLSYGLLGLMGLALLLSYSRSAWLGLVAGSAAMFVLLRRQQVRRHVLLIGIVFLACLGFMFSLRDTGFGRTILLHADQKTGTSISNQGHLLQSSEAVKQIIQQPLGTGVGTAGPASALVENGDARIAENYYLQVGQEVGIIGLVLFVGLTIYVGLYFYHRKRERIALALLASLIALTVCNLLLHTWSEEAVALTWWIIAGLAYKAHPVRKKPQ